jgi:hypothetical protein
MAPVSAEMESSKLVSLVERASWLVIIRLLIVEDVSEGISHHDVYIIQRQ